MSCLTCHNSSFTFLNIIKFPRGLIAATNKTPFVCCEVKAIYLVFVIIIGSQSKFLFYLDQLNLAHFVACQKNLAVLTHFDSCNGFAKSSKGLPGLNLIGLRLIWVGLILLKFPNVDSRCGSCGNQAWVSRAGLHRLRSTKRDICGHESLLKLGVDTLELFPVPAILGVFERFVGKPLHLEFLKFHLSR